VGTNLLCRRKRNFPDHEFGKATFNLIGTFFIKFGVSMSWTSTGTPCNAKPRLPLIAQFTLLSCSWGHISCGGR
jgi:hypothetical protein